jgi:chromosomal replication initiation ATPase DnaA
MTLSIPLEPGEVAKITRTGPYIFAERMQFLSLAQARITKPNWTGPVETIQRAVAGFYGIAVEHMRSPWRHRSVAWPRQRAMWLARTLLGKHWVDLGRLFGDRDHSTIIHAIRAVDRRMANDPLERAQMKQLLASLEHLRRPV